MTSISQLKMPDPAMGKAPASGSKLDTDKGGVFSRAFSDEASKAPKETHEKPVKSASGDDNSADDVKIQKDSDAEASDQSQTNDGDSSPSAEDIIALADHRTEAPTTKASLGSASVSEVANSEALKNGAQSVETLVKTDPLPQVIAPTVNVEVGSTASQPVAPNTVQAQAPIIATQRPDWVANVSASIVDASDMAAEAMELTLTPENLGKIQIKMEVKDGATSVTIVTQNEDAARLFNETKNQLSEMLARSGLDLAQHDAQANSERDFGRIAPASGAAQDEQETILNQATSATVPTSLVDLVA